MNTVRCDAVIPKIEGLDDNALTVGRHFTLKCSGEWSKEFDFSQATIVAEGLNPLQMKVFASQAVDIESFEVDATFYAPMKIKSGTLSLSDSKTMILLNHDDIEIKSVIEADGSNEMGGPKPYGFFVGKMDWPLTYAIVLAVVLFGALALIGLGINRRRYWRKLEIGLRDYDSPISPDSQAYRTLRLIEKSLGQLEKNNSVDPKVLAEAQLQLQNCVYLFVLRRYQVPIFQLKTSSSNRKLNAYLKAKWPRLKSQRRQIFHFVSDFNSLSKMTPAEQILSTQKIIKRFYEFVDSSETLFKSAQERLRRSAP